MKRSTIRKVFGVGIAAVALTCSAASCRAQADEAEAKRIAAYPLTPDLFQRYASVTLEMARLPKTDPAYVAMKGTQELPLDGKIRRIEAAPAVMAILKAHGISARDLIMTSASVTAVMVVKAAMQTGAGKNEANHLDWEASQPDHLKFYGAHQAEFTKFQNDLMKAVTHQ